MNIPPGKLPLLNVGCGDHFDPRWTNIDLVSSSPDVIAYDITRGLPFPDATFDAVYHSHILEHLTPDAGSRLLAECRRVLKPGGIVRVVVPDLAFCARLYLDALDAVTSAPDALTHEHYEWAVLNLIDQMVRTRSGGAMQPFITHPTLHDLDYIVDNGGGRVIRQSRADMHTTPAREPFTSRLRRVPRALRRRLARLLIGQSADIAAFRRTGEVHQWMYDRHALDRLLRQTGFSGVAFRDAHTSAIPDFVSAYLDVSADGLVHKPGSLFAEAVR